MGTHAIFGKTERRFWAKCSPIFRSFSADFPPMVPHLPFFRPHVYGLCLFPPIFHLFSAYFRLFFANFQPIFRLKWYPILIINSSMLPICHFAQNLRISPIFRLFSAHFEPIFRLKFRPFSAGPVLPGTTQLQYE